MSKLMIFISLSQSLIDFLESLLYLSMNLMGLGSLHCLKI